MTDHVPGSFGEAMANLRAGFECLGRQVREATRYVQADRHRARLIRTGQYVKTSTHVRGKVLLVNPEDPHNPTVKELRDGTVIGRLNFGGNDEH